MNRSNPISVYKVSLNKKAGSGDGRTSPKRPDTSRRIEDYKKKITTNHNISKSPTKKLAHSKTTTHLYKDANMEPSQTSQAP